MSAWQAAREPTRLTVSRMITALLGDRPDADADPGAHAAWFDRRAEVFDRVADVNAADGDVLRAGEARAAAAEARATAADLHQQAEGRHLDLDAHLTEPVALDDVAELVA